MLLLIEAFFRKIAEMFGCSVGTAKMGFASGTIVLALGIYIGFGAAVDLVGQYQRSGSEDTSSEAELQAQQEFSESVRQRNLLPTLLSEGQALPDGAVSVDGSPIRCGPLLQGEVGVDRGWIWTKEDNGCRRASEAMR